MPIPIPSGILRRLQDTLYAQRQPEEDAPQATNSEPATSAEESSSVNGTQVQPVLEDLPFGRQTSPNDQAPYFNLDSHSPQSTNPSSPSIEGITSRPGLEETSSGTSSNAAARRRQSLTPVATPDSNAQALLRKRILEIQSSTTLSEGDKAKRVQALMTEAYLEAQKRRRGSHAEQLQEGELSEKDKAKTYWDEAHGILGCQHYRRGAKLQCSTCNQWATCRHCHDEKEDHKLIRKDTRNMICMHCATPQKAAQYCQNCHIRLARYYCDKCHLWDDHLTKSIYHCADCGICRVGEGLGKDFFHCKTCNVCMSVSLQNSHRCIERNTECDCPICGEYLFTSPETVVFMPCGHSIHQKCYNQHIKTSYRCPTCSRALINMDHYFRLLDAEVRRQPMPAPYDSWQTVILCNDCSAKSRVSFHFVGHKCNLCSSYNTVMCDILKPPEQVPSAQAQLSSTSELVSAGAEATASVAAMVENHAFNDSASTSTSSSSSSA